MNSVFTGLSLVLVLGTVIALIMRRIGQPLIIGHILTGIIVGPAVLSLIHSPETFATFSDIGIALLLFIVGLGLNPRVIREVGQVAGLAGIIGVVFTGLFGALGALVLGLDSTEALFIGIALAFSSTIIILKLLGDKKDTQRLYGKITIGITLVEDMMAAIALLFLIAKGQGSDFSVGSVGFLAMKGFVAGYCMYLISNKLLPRMQRLIGDNQEFLFLFAVAWGFGSAMLFERIGFSHEVGALYGGIMLASLPFAQEISSRLRPLRDFFIILFFITLGAGLHLGDVTRSWGLILFCTIIVVLVKPLVIMSIMGAMGYTKRTSFKSATTLSQVSEFSIIFIVLGVKQGLVRPDLTAIITIVALITIAISTYTITYVDTLYRYCENYLGRFERRRIKNEHERSERYDLVLFGYHKGGHEFLETFRQLKKPYIVIDYDPEVVTMLEHRNINYLYGDANDIELYEEVGLDQAKLIVSMVSDHNTTLGMLEYITKHNPKAVFICLSETPERATLLYEEGASYVMLPHYLGSERISSLIRKVGIKKSEFKKIRIKHLEYLEAQTSLFRSDSQREHTFGKAILDSLTSITTSSDVKK